MADYSSLICLSPLSSRIVPQKSPLNSLIGFLLEWRPTSLPRHISRSRIVSHGLHLNVPLLLHTETTFSICIIKTGLMKQRLSLEMQEIIAKEFCVMLSKVMLNQSRQG